MISKVKDYIQAEKLLDSEDIVVLGVSGGADSICMLQVFCRLRESFYPGLSLHVVHINHGLRGRESDGDETFVADFCYERGLPFDAFRPDVQAFSKEKGLSIEEAGRIMRYDCFHQVADRLGAARIAVAHNRDDCGETILFHLFRGSGLKGLSGIPSKRGRIIRPLLCCSRQEIEAYLQGAGIAYRTDRTNFANDYTRNKIRNQILPLIKGGINERAEENILHAGTIIRQADELLWELAEAFCREQVKGEAEITIPIPAFCQEKPIVQSYIIRYCLRQLGSGLKDITAGHIDSLRDLAAKGTGRWIDLPKGIYARSCYGELRIGREKKDAPDTPSFQMVYQEFPYGGRGEIPQKTYTKWFDCDKIQGTLVVRSRQEGDYIILPGGGKKTVKSFMIDQKIPREERNQIPLLADGRHVLWIIGYRISEGCKVTDDTRRIMQAEYIGGKSDGR